MKKTIWWALILFAVVHFIGILMIFHGNENKNIFEMLVGIIIVFSPEQLYPKMYEIHWPKDKK